MSRFLVLVGLFALFNLLDFPILAATQLPTRQSQQFEENANVKNVVTLTTTDLLNTQDFAPPVMETTAARSRQVNPAKGSKTPVSVKPPEMDEAKGKKGVKATSDNQNSAVAAVADIMHPTVTPAPFNADTEAEAKVNKTPIAVGTGSASIDELVTRSAQRNGVDQRLIYAVMRQESSFNPRATSYKGARGLMQLMPATASRFGVTDIYDPAQNIEGGTRYLRFLLDTFNGDVELALAGYNAGEHAVYRYGNRIPPYRETQDYVRKISAHYIRLTNGETVRRPVTTTTTPTAKKPEGGVLTVGSSMMQY